MINNQAENSMINKENLSKSEKDSTTGKPNESSGIYIRGFVKISDPESGEVIVETGN